MEPEQPEPRPRFWDLLRELGQCYAEDLAARGTAAQQPVPSNFRTPSTELYFAGLDRSRSRSLPTDPKTDLDLSPDWDHHLSRPAPDRGDFRARKKTARTSLLDIQGVASTDFSLRPHAQWLDGAQAYRMTQTRSCGVSIVDVSPRGSDKQAEVAQPLGFSALHPEGGFKMRWSLLLAVCVLYDLMLLPLYVFYVPSGMTFSILEWFTHLVWNMDIFVSALTGFYLKGLLVLEPRRTLRQYARSWLIFDVFLVSLVWVTFGVTVAMPEDAEEDRLLSWTRTLRALRFLRFVRILRWLKLRRVVDTLQQVIGSPFTSLYFSLFSTVFRLLILNHLVACCWFGVSHLAVEPTWVSETGIAGKSVLSQYLQCLNWSFAQLGVGSSNIYPRNALEEGFCVVVAVRSLLTYATLVSAMTNLMTGLSKIREGEETDFRLLHTYLKDNDIPESLRQKVARFVEHQYFVRKDRKVGDVVDVPVLSLLSPQLRGELMLARYQKALCRLPLARDLLVLDNIQVVQVMQHLATTGLRDTVVAGGDAIFYAGNHATAAYFSVYGEQNYRIEEEYEVLSTSSWIAEVCLYTPWVYQGDFVAGDVSRLIALDEAAFRQSLCQCQLTQKVAAEYARRFLNFLTAAEALTDLPLRESEDAEEELPIPAPRGGALCPSWRPRLEAVISSAKKVKPAEQNASFFSIQGPGR